MTIHTYIHVAVRQVMPHSGPSGSVNLHSRAAAMPVPSHSPTPTPVNLIGRSDYNFTNYNLRKALELFKQILPEG